MRPRRIVLLRHGETEANLDDTLYAHKPDHAMELTERGRQQSREVGARLRRTFGTEKVRVYVSPYLRGWQTLSEANLADLTEQVREEPRLREQDWGNLQDLSRMTRARRERDEYGHFFYRFDHGESGADVYDRVSGLLETLYRHFAAPDFPPNALLVTHGLTMRLFCMRWFHWTVDHFESLENPGNCETRTLTRTDHGYELDRPFAQWRASGPQSPDSV